MVEKPIIVRFDFFHADEEGSAWFVLHPTGNNTVASGANVYGCYKAESSIDASAVKQNSSLTLDASGVYTLSIQGVEISISATLADSFSTSPASWTGGSLLTFIQVLLDDSQVISNETSYGFYIAPPSQWVAVGIAFGANETGAFDALQYIGPRNVWAAAGGTLVLPVTGQVQAGVPYGPDTDTAPEMFGSLVLPDESNVLYGVSYGDTEASRSGSYRPIATTFVKAGELFGPNNSLTGSYDPVSPAVAAQLAADVAEVDNNKASILRPADGGPDDILGVVGTLAGLTPTIGKTRCSLVCYDPAGDPDPDAKVQIQMTAPGNAGAWSSEILVVTCDEDGRILDPVDGEVGVNLATGRAYRAKRGTAAAASASEWVSFTPTGDTSQIPALYGSDE